SFQSKALEVRWCGPLTKADHFYGNNAIETLLPGPKHHSLTAPTDFLQQLIVTQLSQHRAGAHTRFRARLSFRISILDGTAVIAIGYSLVRGDTERCFQHATHAKSFRCVGKDFCAALSANSNYAGHKR